MLALLLAALPAEASLSRPQGGPAFDLAAGLGLRGAPLAPNGGALVAAGWWAGKYDDDYALGRYWWVGPSARVDVGAPGVGLTPMFEIRRGLELLVVGVAPFVAGGPTLTLGEPGVGGTARAGVMLKLRRSRTVGLSARLEAGADFGAAVGFAGGVLVGLSYARPSHALGDLGATSPAP